MLVHDTLDTLRRIQRSIEYIRQHIHQSLSAEEVAKVACYSPFHFQRIFKEVMGEPLGEYITRKKLETAAIKIAYGRDVNITDIAFRYGYSSLSNFSKAFERFFGHRPREIRDVLVKPPARKGKLQSKYLKSLSSEELFTDEPRPDEAELQQRYEAVEARLEIRTVDPFEVVFQTSPKGYDLEAINRLWQDLNERIEDLGLEQDDVARFAICHDHPGLFPRERCRYDACFQLRPELAALPLLRTTIPGGRYAIFTCHGPPESVLGQYIEFATIWLPRSGYEPTDFPTVDHLLPASQAPAIQQLWRRIRRVGSS